MVHLSKSSRLESLGAGGASDSTLFSDSMLSPDQPFEIGTEWVWMWDPNAAGSLTGPQTASAFNRGVNGLTVTNPTGGGTLPQGFGFPRPLSWSLLNGKSQFVEYLIQADNSGGGLVTRMGPMVLCNPNVGNCYWIELVVETGPFLVNIGRWVNGATTNLAQIAANGFAIGDKVAIGASVNTVSASVDLTYYRNGVATLAVTDSSASVLLTGMPGFHVSGISTARSQTFNTFRAGTLASR